MTQRVAIICGGRSSEHEISCISAAGVLSAIDRQKYQPILIGISKNGRWFLLPDTYSLALTDGVLPSIPEEGISVSLSADGFNSEGKNLDIDIYMINFKGFFDKNPDQLNQLIGSIDSDKFFDGVRHIVEENSKEEDKPLEPTKKQLIELILNLNGVGTNVEKVLPYINHHMGLICMN
jgi:D-alanine-D-alanine ligase-like ATP-grasp enzyme